MPLEGDKLYLTRDELVDMLVDNMQVSIPDIYVGDDGNFMILCQVMATIQESLFIAQQLLGEDMFVTTANFLALERYGDQYNFPLKYGTKASGSLLFSGVGGTYVPVGASVDYDPGTGVEPLYYNTTQDGIIPNAGIANAPTLADLATGGNLNGTFEYVVTFVTSGGETVAGPESSALAVSNSRIRLTNISLGGPGTTGRRIYRSKNGAAYQLVTTINDNTTVLFDDNVADGALGGAPLEEGTANRITLTAQAEDYGIDYNAAAGTIIELSDVPDGLTSVTNPAPFIGGTNPEDHEDYRVRLLEFIRAPGSGSPSDLQAWAEEVTGVETATVFPNDNLGTPTNGHVTVRISGPNGQVPDATVQTNVLNFLNEKDIANIIIHVGTFSAVSTDVTVSLTLEPNYVLGDVQQMASDAIKDYINSLPVAGTLYRNGIIDALFGLPGIANLTVSVPGSDLTTPATSRRVPGTITVT